MGHEMRQAGQAVGTEVNPVYDLSSDRERLRLAVALMHREQRIELCRRIRARYGEQAGNELSEGLKEIAAQRRSTGETK